jgi:hypothetical protein
MPRFFAAVVLVCVIAFPKFRKLPLAAAELLVMAIAALIVNSQSEERAARVRIPFNEVELVGVALQQDTVGHDYTIIGRVRNHSPEYTLADSTLKVTLEDCVSETNCDAIYQAMKSPLLGSVPPSQAR